MRRFTLPAPEPYKGRLVHYIIADSIGELGRFASESNLPGSYSAPSWDMNLGIKGAIELCTKGDLSAVPESDALLAKLESYTAMPSTRAVWRDDVAGYFPNVPAYLAGSPMSMRRRVREENTSAPLAIIPDLGISGGITALQTRARGTAILALTRALSGCRPIELWAADMGAADEHGPYSQRNCVVVACRIQTTPLDLSSACYALTHPAFVRQVLFGLEGKYHGFIGGWPFGIGRALKRDEMERIMAPAFPQVSETLCLPGLHLTDESVTNPLAWLKRQIAEHDPLKLEDA